LLAGLAAHSLTVSTAQVIAAFATTAVVFVALLITAAVVVSSVSAEALRPVRMTGTAVRRWSGYVLIAIGAWFVVLAVVPSPILVP
jgi:hypothetical protein